MQAALYRGNGDLSVQEVATPEPGAGEVLVQIDSTTICGTDLRIATGAKSKGVEPPVVLGHELAGTVAVLGEGVLTPTVGTKVGFTPTITCGRCNQCELGHANLCSRARVLGHDVDGGLAEYFLAPADAVRAGNLVVAPQSLQPEEISLAEPLSCVLHGQELMGLAPGDVVLVLGGGAIGQLHAQLAKVRGARTVIVSEPVPARRELALRLGADVAVDPTTEDLATVVHDLTSGQGADVVVVCIGAPALVDQALSLAAKRGKVSLFAGFPAGVAASIDPNTIHYRELLVFGSSNSTTSEYEAAMQLIADGRIDVMSLISHRFSLDEVDTALQMAVNPDALKVAVVPTR